MNEETIKTLLDLLNPLHGSLDKQISDDRLKDYYETPPDREWEVTITNQMERDLTQAVLILEDRLRSMNPIKPKDVVEAFTPSGADCHPESPHASTFKTRPKMNVRGEWYDPDPTP